MSSGGSNYLDGSEDLYGLPATLPAGIAEQASAIIDAHLKRPEGICYQVDKNGNPAYMKALVPSFTYALVGAISAGLNVVATLSPPNVRPDMVGEVLVLDRVNADAVEAVVIASTTGNNQVTFQNVQFAHPDAAKADLGLVITEERSLPAKRSIARYSKFPAVSILSLLGRYGYGRRSDQFKGFNQEFNLLASVQAFGGPPAWVPISTNQLSWSDASGEIWIPAGILLAYFTDVKIKYLAGFAEPPDPVIRATAAVAASLASQTVGGNIKTIQAGDTRIDRYGSTNLDDDSKRLLNPYMARLFF
jgi:hypothetical protein